MRYMLVAVALALLVGATTALGGSTRSRRSTRLGITNGVIHACVRPADNDRRHQAEPLP